MDDAEREELAANSIDFATRMANKWGRMYNLDYEEAQSTAFEALVKAARDYDPSRGPFQPMAGTYIKRALMGKRPYIQGKMLSRVDFDAPKGGEDDSDDTVASSIGDPQAVKPGTSREEISTLVQQAIESLPERQRRMVIRWMNKETYRDIAPDEGVSFTEVGIQVRRALTKMEEFLKAHGVDKEMAFESVKSLRARAIVESLINNPNQNVGALFELDEANYSWCPIKKVLFNTKDDSIALEGKKFSSVKEARDYFKDHDIDGTIQ